MPTLLEKIFAKTESAGTTTPPARVFPFNINKLAAIILGCCQMATAPALAGEGECIGVDGSDQAAMGRCIIEELCIEGIYHLPRSVSLSKEAVAAYHDQEFDVTLQHFRLEVRFRKRAGAAVGQCGYTGPNRFMFSLVEPNPPSGLAVVFDPDWTY